MEFDTRIAAEGDISGWVLVESRVGRTGRRDSSSLLVKRRSGAEQAAEILLPITPHGRIHEIVRLPGDCESLTWWPPHNGRSDRSQLRIRRLGWLERTLRMAHRVLRNWARLTGDERKISGLTLWRVLTDLPGAYRIATQFRGYLPYADWVRRFDTLCDGDERSIRAAIEGMASRPHFHLLLLADGAGRAAVRSTQASLCEQIYREFTCAVLGAAADAVASDGALPLRVVERDAVPGWLDDFNAALALQAGAWVMLLRAGDVLPAHALYWFACEVLAQPQAAVLYSDDDVLDGERRRCDPRFKPDWSLTHLRSTHYLGEVRLGDVCDESDLLQPNRESVGRLLALLGERAPPGVTGETPEQIAVLMHALRLDPAATGRLDYRQSSRPQPAGKRGEREVSVTTILEQLRKTAPGLLAAIPPPKATALIERIFMHMSEHLAQAEERMITYEGFGEFRVRKIEREPDGERVTRVTLRLIDPTRHQLATPKAQAEVTVTAAASRRTGAG